MDKDCKNVSSRRAIWARPMKELAEDWPMLDHGRCLLSAKRREPFWKKEICKCHVCYSTDSLRRPSWVIDIHRKKIKNMRPPSVGRTVHSRDKEIKELRELKWQWHGFKRSFQGLRNRKWRNKASHIALCPTICIDPVVYVVLELFTYSTNFRDEWIRKWMRICQQFQPKTKWKKKQS